MTNDQRHTHLERIPAAAPGPVTKALCSLYLALSAVLFRLTGGFLGPRPLKRASRASTAPLPSTQTGSGEVRIPSLLSQLTRGGGWTRRGRWVLAARVRLGLAAGTRAVTGGYREVIKAAYRLSLAGGTMRIAPFDAQACATATVCVCVCVYTAQGP